ncbi:MAG: TonB-dependent receptor [Tannerella sp.]|jgi:TonB-linked SusC/RagA family outer membrane protein|nr:TonB-dependent receptor [Tannerella sp.]
MIKTKFFRRVDTWCRALSLLCILSLCSLSAFAQKRVAGTVTDATGETAIGANVVEKGTTNGTSTDADGKFSLTVGENAILQISYIGYISQDIRVTSDSVYDVRLVENAVALDEVVAIGYGTVKRSDLTGAIATLASKDISTNIESKVMDAIQGKVAGLSIESLGGEPGSGMRIQIRGAGSLTNNNPLVLIDGVPGSMEMLNTNNIKSMQILKDASASAIYGARAANGVILIETTGGQKGNVQFSVNVDYGIQQLADKMDMLNAEQWRRVNSDARAAAGLPPSDYILDYLGDLPTVGTDWQDAMYVNAPVGKYNLSAGGGTESANYNFSLGWLDQDGIVQTTQYQQLNIQAKSDWKTGRFKFGESLIITKEFKKNTPGDGAGRGDVIETAVMSNPNMKIYKKDYTDEQQAMALTPVGSGSNVIGILNLDRNEYDLYRIFFEAFTEVDLFDGLKYKLNVGTSNSLQHNLYARPIYALQDVYAMGTQLYAQDGELNESNSTSTYWLVENTLNYQKVFGKHSVNVLLGQSAEKSAWRNAGGNIYGLPDGIQVLSAGSRNATVSGTESANTISSLFGRAIYSFDSKYIFTGTLRRDGSSRFSDRNKYGTFPSVAVAWNVSNESFMENIPAISKLRLRANYGVLGNESIGNYQYLGLIQPSFYYTTGNSTNWIGATQVNYPAVGIKWESTATTNVGIDLGLWNGRFDFTFDYFKKTTTDLLLQIPIPSSAGSGSDPYGNAGKVANNGFETLLTYNGKVNDFNFSVTGTFSRIRNEVLDLSTTSQQLSGAVASLHGGAPVTYTKVGYPIYSFFVIKTDGLFRNQAEVDAHSKDGELIQRNAKPGDIRFVDYNGDGIIDGNDRQYCGSGFPDFDYGLRIYAEYKGIDLNLFLQGTQGNKIYNAFRTYTESVRAGNNYTTKVLDSYTYNPAAGNYPRLDVTDPNGNDIDNSDRYLEDGSYLRFKTLSLGYNFPKNLLNALSIQSARVYVGVQNLFTLTKYEGYNPDIGGGQYQGSGLGTRGVDYSVYPIPRSYHVGIQFNF